MIRGYTGPISTIAGAAGIETYPNVPNLVTIEKGLIRFYGRADAVWRIIQEFAGSGRHLVWSGDYYSAMYLSINPRTLGEDTDYVIRRIRQLIETDPSTNLVEPCVLELNLRGRR